MITSVFRETQITTDILGGNYMADMLVKLYNIPHSHDIEKKQEAFVMESFTDALNQSNLEKIRVWRLVLC